MAVIEINESIGEEISNLSLGESIEINDQKYILHDVVNNHEEHRWCSTSQFILIDSNEICWQMLYDYGLTEEQESGFIYNKPELKEVNSYTKSVTYYTVVNDAD